MEKNCATCFYHGKGTYDYVCDKCRELETRTYPKWEVDPQNHTCQFDCKIWNDATLGCIVPHEDQCIRPWWCAWRDPL